MPLKTSIFLGLRGVLRIATLVIGLVCLSITAAHYISDIGKEGFFLAIVILAFLFSLIWTFVLLFDLISSSETAKYIDIGFHLLTSAILFILSIVWFASVFGVGSPCNDERYKHKFTSYTYDEKLKKNIATDCSSSFALRILVGLIGFINATVYGTLGWFVFINKG